MCGIEKKNTEDIARVQRSSLKIIIGTNLSDYEESLDEIKKDVLKSWRDKLCLNFAKYCIKDTFVLGSKRVLNQEVDITLLCNLVLPYHHFALQLSVPLPEKIT